MTAKRSPVTNRIFLVLSTLMVCLLVPVTPASASPEQSRQEIIDLIQEVDADIEKQSEKLEQVTKRSKQETSSLQDERKQLARKLIDLRKQNKTLDGTIEQTKKQRKRVQQTVNDLEQKLDQARNLFPLIRSIIQQHIKNVPPSRSRSNQRSLLKEANQLMNEENDPVGAIDTSIQVLISLLRESRQAQQVRTHIRTPDGQKREVDLIRAGKSFVAYRTADGTSHGIRVNGKNGYRWQTRLTSNQKQRINDAIRALSSTDESAASGQALSFTLPFDPTQEMSRTPAGTGKTLYERVLAGGPVMIPLALIALIALILVLERFWTLRREKTNVNDLLGRVQSALQEGDYDRARSICRSTPGAVPAVLDTLITSRDEDPETTQDRVEEEILRQMPRLERFLPSLNVLAGVAPLLGLLGTVTGIIETFDVIAVFGAGNQELMAGGISEALMTTATGLAIAIPVLLCHGYFRSRVDTIIGNMERTAATIYNFLQSDEPDPAGPDE